MTKTRTVYLVEQQPERRQHFETVLTFIGETVEVISPSDTLKLRAADALCVIAGNGIENLHQLAGDAPHLPFICATDDQHNALQKANVIGPLEKSFDYASLSNMLHYCQAYHQQMPAKAARKRHPGGGKLEQTLVGNGRTMKHVRQLIEQVAVTEANVLILGESGTGKEVVARGVHDLSGRSNGPFVPVNCGAIPGDLLESELFGHEKGAFTGAIGARKGRFELAQGGTLFLDEIGDMPLPVQTRLLRVLAEGQFYPVGALQPVKVDVRVIAATHRELEHLVNQGTFRDDLYHRLNVIRLRLPPLRERAEDIDTLARHFLKKSAEELNVTPKTLLNETLSTLKSYNWPGNVRQLENTCRWLTVMAPGQQISPRDLPEDILVTSEPGSTEPGGELTWLHFLQTELEQQPLNSQDVLQSYQQQLEQVALQTALKRFSGHKQKAAAWLGWGRNTLTRKLKTLLK
ncbi:MAG TPA: hypothetical protein DCR51_04505 [Idiomarina loihiensis]|nr:hypothetical protein [Idiomarina loihiensis]